MLFDLLSGTAARHAHRTALIAEDGTHLSYAALHAAASAFSRTLAESGVASGDHVIVLLPNTPDFVVATFAVARIGAVLVPLNPVFRSAELRYYFSECRAAAVITDRDHGAVCERVQRSLRQPPSVFTALDGPRGVDGSAWPQVAPEAAALCQYSSGSTGLPKAIVRSHAQLCAEAEHFVTTVGVDPGERILTVVPLFHAHGFGNCLLAGIRAGATLVLHTAFHRRRTIATLIEEQISMFPGVPFMFGILASSTSITGQPFPHLRLAFSAGAALPHDVFDGFQEKFGVAVRQLYGSTETGSVSINLGSCAGDRWASVGQPMRGIEVEIVDAWGRRLPAGERGEILVRSPAAATGYRGLDDASQAAFRGGSYWSSDLGYRDLDGNIFVTGRTTIFIDTGGHKVDPVEVEKIISRHPKVAQCVVLGVKGRFGRQLVKAVIVARDPCTSDEIAAWCRGRLADFKIPRLIEFRREIPTNALGKVLRKYLH